MSALSFREQAAISLLSANIESDAWNHARRPQSLAVEWAGLLAVAACEAWGHDGDSRITSGWSQPIIEDRLTCRRCGEKLEAP